MFEAAHGNLVRQLKGLEVLETLLTEEFAELRERQPEAITSIEFSIHELMRQLAAERIELKDSLGGQRLTTVMELLTEEQQEALNALLQYIDALEQSCAKQASINAELALALHDQSQALLEHIQEQVKPKNTNTYGKKGRYTEQRPQAMMLHGRL